MRGPVSIWIELGIRQSIALVNDCELEWNHGFESQIIFVFCEYDFYLQAHELFFGLSFSLAL